MREWREVLVKLKELECQASKDLEVNQLLKKKLNSLERKVNQMRGIVLEVTRLV